MKAGKCLCCALTIGVIMFSVTAFGQEIRWQPVSATVASTLDDQGATVGTSSEIFVEVVPAQVSMEIRMQGWGTAPGTPCLGTFQGTLDSAGFATGSGDALSALEPWVDTAIIDLGRSDWLYAGQASVPAVSTATADFEYGASPIDHAQCDDGTIFYGGQMEVVVPAGAAGTYTIDFNPADTKTFFNNATGAKIPGLVRTPGLITIPEGACCYELPDPLCVFTTESDCMGNMAYAAPKVWSSGVLCPPGGPECPKCIEDTDCADPYQAGPPEVNPNGGVCTDDTCVLFVCHNMANYDPAYCCNPVSGELTEIDDDNECTADVCNGDGSVDHNDLTGTDCTHENACVINDVCDAGVCVGDLPTDLMLACPPDCPAGWFCNDEAGHEMEGLCDCRLSTPLALVKDAVCVAAGDPVNVALQMGAGSAVVTGFQALMTYEPCCVDFVSVGPCEESMFSTVVDWWVDEVAGEVWYAAIAYDEVTYAVDGTTGPYDLACMEFTRKSGVDCDDVCGTCEFCIISRNPLNTLLTNDRGQSVDLDIDECISDAMLDTPLSLYVPAGARVNSNCGVSFATVTWETAPYAEDICNDFTLVCDLEHDGNPPVALPDDLYLHGGVFPQGTTYFVCTATDTECGGEVTKVWTVDVSDQHALDVEVHLGPTMVAGMYTRCICFYLYDSSAIPEPFCTAMAFGGPWNFPDHARETIKIDKGNYVCIEARDPLHTLRSTADVECIDNAWTAVFKGDPALQYVGKSHWLVGGNLDFYEPGGNPDVIDVLDFGVYMFEVSSMAAYAPGGNDCAGGDASALYPHADINADGFVDALDYAFLTENYLADSKHGCFEDPGSVVYTPVLDITVKELRQRGMGHLAVGDLNHDGRLNGEDMALYSQGVVPTRMKTDRIGR